MVGVGLLAHASGHAEPVGSVALIVAILAVAAVALLDPRTPAPRRLLLAVAAGGMAFQMVHVLEHLLQVGYWVAHPAAPAWLTPWAAAARDALAVDGSAVTGVELLHLGGNVIFFVGVLGVVGLTGQWRGSASRSLKAAVVAQGVHVAEHALIVATWLVMGRVVAVSTLFGLLPEGTAVAVAFRVWLHLGLNLTATVLATVACCNVAQPWWHARRHSASVAA